MFYIWSHSYPLPPTLQRGVLSVPFPRREKQSSQMLTNIPKAVHPMSGGSGTDGSACLPALCPLSLTPTRSSARMMTANSVVYPQTRGIPFLLFPQEGVPIMQFSGIHPPKDGSPGSGLQKPAPLHPLCHTQALLEVQELCHSLPLALAVWRKAEVRGRKARKGSDSLCPVCSLVPSSRFRVIGSGKWPECLAIYLVTAGAGPLWA